MGEPKHSTMRKTTLVLSAIALFAFACDTKPRGDEATVSEEKSAADADGVEWLVDTTGSMVGFTGWGVGKNHPGRFKFNSGTMTIKDGELTSGTFVIAVTTLSMDEDGEMFDEKLRGHLLSADFFEAEVYPDAKFVITKVEPYTGRDNDTSVVVGANRLISGNLTLKGVTKNVTFPARVDIDENNVTAKANFDIDRTQWNMHYNEDKESAKDKFIEHDVNIKLDIKAKR